MNIRKKIIVRLFELSEQFYTRHFKKHKQPWNLTRTILTSYPENSFGNHIGLFLQENNFELIPKVERHDAYHVLTGYGTNVEDEIALQYLCLGNGKRSPYLFGVIVLGTLLLPDYLRYYRRSFRRGKQAYAFHHWDFQKLLKTPLDELRLAVFPKEYIEQLSKSIQVSLK
ncbi:Coq4 family protein [Aureitalea sp. L0-47]|uniref:Coq4 family protein n=1 Tax=Aureitalea sp. L0-47 TaxID=2816962 RepID=UPI00223700DA|nr:Coq4 family protein [Aureitalea sp. L0-47]